MLSTTGSTSSPAACQPALYRLAPEAVLVPVADGSARLIDLDGQYFALCEVAAHMLRATLELGPASAAQQIADARGVERGRVEAELNMFLAALLRHGLLLPADWPACKARWPRLRTLPARLVVSGLIRLTRSLWPTDVGKAAGLLRLARLSCRLLGWAGTVRLWQRLFPRPRRPVQGVAAERARHRVDQAVCQALAQSPVAAACKERGLVSWALARRAGLTPLLVIGLAFYPLAAHCWAELDGTFLGDDPARCADFQPIHFYE
jgi:hypothetical protein